MEPGPNKRHRDKDGEISLKDENPWIGTLREIAGLALRRLSDVPCMTIPFHSSPVTTSTTGEPTKPVEPFVCRVRLSFVSCRELSLSRRSKKLANCSDGHEMTSRNARASRQTITRSAASA